MSPDLFEIDQRARGGGGSQPLVVVGRFFSENICMYSDLLLLTRYPDGGGGTTAGVGDRV